MNLLKIFFFNRETYGTRRLKHSLVKKYGIVISKRRISNIMQCLNLRTKMKRRFKVTTTNSNHDFTIAANRINRDFYSSNQNDKYVGDITYIKTNQGFLYLATVMFQTTLRDSVSLHDLYSRKIVGWNMDDMMKTSLVNDALIMAIKRRNPAKGLIWYTDRGTQYASYEHKDLGDCWDNAVSESFFHFLKTELVYHESFKTKAQANEMIFEYIEIFYIRQRLHSYNNYMSPVEFEEKMLRLEIVA